MVVEASLHGTNVISDSYLICTWCPSSSAPCCVAAGADGSPGGAGHPDDQEGGLRRCELGYRDGGLMEAGSVRGVFPPGSRRIKFTPVAQVAVYNNHP